MSKFIKFLFFSAFFYAILIILYINLRDYYEIFYELNFKQILISYGLGMVLISLIGFINDFLGTNKYSKNNEKINLEIEYKNLLNKYDIAINGSNVENNIEEATNLLKDKLENISAESYFKEFKNKIKIDVMVENFEYKAKRIESRVQNEIGRLSKSGIINLSLGMMLSIGGIIYLGNFVVNVKIFETMEEMFINTFPKTVFVLLIEVFAYFFLRLYKQNLNDIKYYQNELTNIESKNLAIQFAKQSNNNKLLALCVEEFLSTERNFILEKDQSTIELEKERINSNNANNTLQAIKDIFQSKK